ncbi:tannase and feruloyl esterase-domain-containing protein [Aspergillus leporis]|uniref:Carboxylic ester hydrolase n=1 Tax=Aspergillus leporis TaxID=41062 RepID=A0A5N5WJX9_9EURO|nr:tannase and feruloyl esterase-domain-containing protein [Aspergillus leporis]
MSAWSRVSITAAELHSFASFSLAPGTINAGTYTIDFCNTTVAYTHRGWNDTIHVRSWLTLENCNGRLQALDGGVYSATFGYLLMIQAVAGGYWPLILTLTLAIHQNSRTILVVSLVAVKFSWSSRGIPDFYDGILSMVPAINMENFILADFWAQQLMKTLGAYPSPYQIRIFCNGTGPEKLTEQGATICSSNRECSVTASNLMINWIRYFIAKDPQYPISNMTDEDFLTAVQVSDREHHSMLKTTSPGMPKFRDAGGKMLSLHGIADEVFPLNGTIAYYQQVLKLDPTANGYYRFFDAPGVGHCQPASGPFPNDAMEQLIAYIEEGIVPHTLNASSPDGP